MNAPFNARTALAAAIPATVFTPAPTASIPANPPRSRLGSIAGAAACGLIFLPIIALSATVGTVGAVTRAGCGWLVRARWADPENIAS